jgi:hypothetical protein
MLVLATAWLGGAGVAHAATYTVGPGRSHETIGSVPWEHLQPGDRVLIHWRPAPYREKWVIASRGTETAPVVVSGVPGPSGALPVIDGGGATTHPRFSYWNQNRSIVKVGGSSHPRDVMPSHLIIERLEITGAKPSNTFVATSGAVERYAENAAAIHVEKGQHVTIRECVLRDSGNGLFVSSPAVTPSSDILVTGNHIYDNGIVGSSRHHNSYTEAVGIVFQHNRFGPLRVGAEGNNIKDRSAGLVVRFNWIEGGNRQLDLVDTGNASVQASARYRETLVYGNVLIEPAGAGNRQIVHYGGDGANPSQYRKGVLRFFHNTIVSTRSDRTTAFRISTGDERVECENNILFVSASGGSLSLVTGLGTLVLSHNWLKPGAVASYDAAHGPVLDDGTSVWSATPGFVDAAAQDYRLTANSAAVDRGKPLTSSLAPLLTLQYKRHATVEPRPSDGLVDIGAFEFDRDTNNPPAVTLTTPQAPVAFAAPASLSLAATATDPDGDVLRVDFYANGTAIASDTAPPFSVTWNAVPEGVYELTAEAVDDQGATSTSPAVVVTVASPQTVPGAPPVVLGASGTVTGTDRQRIVLVGVQSGSTILVGLTQPAAAVRSHTISDDKGNRFETFRWPGTDSRVVSVAVATNVVGGTLAISIAPDFGAVHYHAAAIEVRGPSVSGVASAQHTDGLDANTHPLGALDIPTPSVAIMAGVLNAAGAPLQPPAGWHTLLSNDVFLIAWGIVEPRGSRMMSWTNTGTPRRANTIVGVAPSE